jgi:hypothetical protein
MENNCLTESYENNLKKTDYVNNRRYLVGQSCCDKKSCDNLAYEYEKLKNKCNDVYKSDNETDEKGIIIDKNSICHEWDLKRMKYTKLSDSFPRGGKKKGKTRKHKTNKYKKSAKRKNKKFTRHSKKIIK